MREVVNLEVEGEDTNTNAAGLFLRGGWRGGPNERRALSKDSCCTHTRGVSVQVRTKDV